MFLSDFRADLSVFNVNTIKTENSRSLNFISFSVNKDKIPKNTKGMKRSHVIFTYYFCCVATEDPSTTYNRLHEKIDSYLLLFNESFIIESSNPEIKEQPI